MNEHPSGQPETDDDPVVPPWLLPLWRERLPRLIVRLGVVEEALTGQADRQEGFVEAHKLHGLLGTFGHQRGSAWAARAEELLGGTEPPSTDSWLAAASECERLRAELVEIEARDGERT